LCGVRDHAAWFLAQAAFAQAAQDTLAFAAAQAVAAGSAPAASTEAETAAEAVTVPGAAAGALLPAQPAKAFSPPLAAAASGWPAGWPVPGAPPGAGLLTRASSPAVPLKEALKWRLASRLPHTLGLPALPPPAWATGASAGHALRASSDAAAASARGESPFAVAAAFGVVAVSELCALDLCVEPSVAALSDAPSEAAAADGQLAELLGLGPASDQRGGSGGGFGGGGGKRARGGWDAGGGGGGKWAKGGKGGKGSKGGKGGKRERDASTSAADAVVSDDAVASSAAKGSTEAATAAAAAAAADAAASVPNGEAMNARCEGLRADGQRALAAWLAAQAAPAAWPESSAATAAPTALAWTCAWQRPPLLLGGRYASSALGAFSGGVWSERCPISFVLSVSVL
jgi:hypothetical protein